MERDMTAEECWAEEAEFERLAEEEAEEAEEEIEEEDDRVWDEIDNIRKFGR